MDTPVGVQLDRRRDPHLAFGGLLGDGAKLGHQPVRRVQGHRALVRPTLPGQLAGDQLLAAAEFGVKCFEPAGALLVAAQHPHSLGGLVGLPAKRPRPMLGQRQPVAGGEPLAAATCAGGLGAGLFQVGQGLPAGPLQLSRAPLGQRQLAGAVRWALGPRRGAPVALLAQLLGGPPPHIHQARQVAGQGLAAVAAHDPAEQLLGLDRHAPRMRVGLLDLDAERRRPDSQVQVGALLGPRQLHVAALHVLGAVQRQQRPLLGAALRAHVRARVGQVRNNRAPSQ